MSELANAIKKRFGLQYLVEITNNDSDETTINDVVLECACDDAIGEFNRVVGEEYDNAIKAHTGICVKGVLYFLEYYKARDVSLINSRQKDFYASLAAFRGVKYISPQTNSNLTVQRERGKTKADMDRTRQVFSGTAARVQAGFGFQDTIEP